MYSVMQIEILPVTADQLRKVTCCDPVLEKVFYYVKTVEWPMVVSEEMQPYKVRQHELSVESKTSLWGIRVIIPSQLRKEVMLEH